MLEKVVVPLDGSVPAESALPHAAALATALGARIDLLRVVERNDGESPPVSILSWRLRKEEAQRYLDQVCERLTAHQATARPILLDGSPPERILHYARHEDADLLLFSSHGEKGISRWNMSSVARKLVLQAETSLMVVPPQDVVGARPPLQAHYRRIMVPLDGARRSEVILPLARALARHFGAELLLVHVLPPLALFPSLQRRQRIVALADDLEQLNEREAYRYLVDLQARLPGASEVRLLKGARPAEALMEVEQEQQIDLVLLNAHGAACAPDRPYGRFVGDYLEHARTPVLVHQDLGRRELSPVKAEEAAPISSAWRATRRAPALAGSKSG
ncbi:MAG: universal stress protein [Candidatus Promineifilaceae bacterium]|nr:universal stress protein [Candidatus Promineifilaceae bacterium]